MSIRSILLYQIRKDGHSEYCIHCPTCNCLYEIHERYMGREIKDNKICPECKFVLPVGFVYAFICRGLYIKPNEYTFDISKELKQLFHIYHNQYPEYELCIYDNYIEIHDNSYILK